MRNFYTKALKVTVRLLIAAAILPSAWITASANEISQSEALRIARNFGNDGRTTLSTVDEQPQLLKEYTATNGDAALYIFSRGDGFIMVAGDDNVVTPVLGYADNGFDLEHMPDAMKWWIEQYVSQVDEVKGSPTTPPKRMPRINDGLPDAVAPLLGYIAWSQSDPYNNDCPEINGEHCVTGCVATSIAQVMKYHEWPAQGKGQFSYTWVSSAGRQTLSVDYSAQTYNWDLMTDHYNDQSTPEQQAEVAHLMYNVGVGVAMGYGLNASGAASTASVCALLNNFDYDNTIKFRYRSLYEGELWEEILRQELAAGRPVIYAGQSDEGGHQFVCDGYDADGYFHFNWGWAGMCNGYFQTTALVPSGVGIGGFASGYNYNQSIITGIQPYKGSDPSNNASYIGEQFSTSDGINFSEYIYALTFIGGTMNCDLGLAYLTENEPVVHSSDVVATAKSLTFTCSPISRTGSSFSYTQVFNGSLSVDPVNDLNLPDGTYYIYPVAKPQTASTWEIIPCPEGQFVQIDIENGQITIVQQPQAQVKLVSLNVPEIIPIKKEFQISGELAAIGDEFYSTVNAYLYNAAGTAVASGSSILLDIPAGDTSDFTVNFSTSTTLEPGQYNIRLIVSNQAIGPFTPVTLQSQAVEITPENFPDQVFRDYISTNFDTDKDGILSDAELSVVTEIRLQYNTMESLDGIEHFYDLQKLFVDYNNLTEIDFTLIPNLTATSFCCNQITSIDISKCNKLQYLQASWTKVHSVDVPDDNMLNTLMIIDDPVLGIDLSNLESLKNFRSDSNATVKVNSNGEFSFDDYPEVDTSRISNLDGATLTGSTLKFNKQIATYDYDTGNPEFAALHVKLKANGIVSADAPVDNGTTITTADGAIEVSGAESMSVSDLSGRTIYAGPSTTINVTPGIYLVSAGQESTKVIVK